MGGAVAKSNALLVTMLWILACGSHHGVATLYLGLSASHSVYTSRGSRNALLASSSKFYYILEHSIALEHNVLESLGHSALIQEGW
jgi:hypothetical protein